MEKAVTVVCMQVFRACSGVLVMDTNCLFLSLVFETRGMSLLTVFASSKLREDLCVIYGFES